MAKQRAKGNVMPGHELSQDPSIHRRACQITNMRLGGDMKIEIRLIFSLDVAKSHVFEAQISLV